MVCIAYIGYYRLIQVYSIFYFSEVLPIKQLQTVPWLNKFKLLTIASYFSSHTRHTSARFGNHRVISFFSYVAQLFSVTISRHSGMSCQQFLSLHWGYVQELRFFAHEFAPKLNYFTKKHAFLMYNNYLARYSDDESVGINWQHIHVFHTIFEWHLWLPFIYFSCTVK